MRVGGGPRERMRLESTNTRPSPLGSTAIAPGERSPAASPTPSKLGLKLTPERPTRVETAQGGGEGEGLGVAPVGVRVRDGEGEGVPLGVKPREGVALGVGVAVRVGHTNCRTLLFPPSAT